MPSTFASIQQLFVALSTPNTTPTHNQIAAGELGVACLELLHTPNIGRHYQGDTRGKSYDVFQLGTNLSRPVNNALFIDDPVTFAQYWNEIIGITTLAQASSCTVWDQTFYTASTAFACAYDLFQPTSRKTPGTFFEIIIANLLKILTGRQTQKYISLGQRGYYVTTDIVLLSDRPDRPHLVIPCKITTRERISQPFVHQRILESVFPRQYKSIFLGLSEMQRNGNIGVNEICVPTQVDIFNSHVATLEGLYYIDLPEGYRNLPNVHTGTLNTLLTQDLPLLL